MFSDNGYQTKLQSGLKYSRTITEKKCFSEFVIFLCSCHGQQCFLSAFSHPHLPSAGIWSMSYRHPIEWWRTQALKWALEPCVHNCFLLVPKGFYPQSTFSHTHNSLLCSFCKNGICWWGKEGERQLRNPECEQSTILYLCPGTKYERTLK